MPSKFIVPLTMSLGILAASWAQAEPAGDAPSLSLLQRVCIKHSAIRTAHVKIQANLPEGWKEQEEFWIDRPMRFNFHSKVLPPAGAGDPIESHILADGGKMTVWSSLPDPGRPTVKNVYMQMEAPPDVADIDGRSGARLGVGEFFLRLLAGEPQRLATASLGESGTLAFERLIKGLGPDQLALVSNDGNQQDELVFDGESGLLKEVRGKSEGKVMATGEFTYVSVNQPSEPGAFDWRVPAGAKELKPQPPRK